MAVADANEWASNRWVKRNKQMGNYKHLEIDFVERSLILISQYESTMHRYKSEDQLNHTLLINCLLGLIVLPKENAINHLPNDRITRKLKDDMGLVHSIFNPELAHLRDFIIALRHSVAHFDIHFVSNDDNFLIDSIVFKDHQKGEDFYVASFVPAELLSFMRYYASWFTDNFSSFLYQMDRDVERKRKQANAF